jgi:hypothetical protein
MITLSFLKLKSSEGQIKMLCKKELRGFRFNSWNPDQLYESFCIQRKYKRLAHISTSHQEQESRYYTNRPFSKKGLIPCVSCSLFTKWGRKARLRTEATISF